MTPPPPGRPDGQNVPAFPQPVIPFPGDLRDYFAAHVIASEYSKGLALAVHGGEPPTAAMMADGAYRIADAMLAARRTDLRT